MRGFISFVFSLNVLAGCDSPMNNRINASQLNQQNDQILKLQSLNLDVEAKWIAGPFGTVSAENHLLVIVKNSAGSPSALPDGLTLNFYSTMPSMGHAMDDAGFFESIGDGLYLNKNIKFNMPGDWRHELWLMDENLNIQEKVSWDEFF